MSELLTATTPYSRTGAEAALLRSEVYLFLSRAFLYPGEELTTPWQRATTAALLLKGEEGRVFLSLEPPPLEALQRDFVVAFTHTNPQDHPVYEIEYGASQPFRDARHLSRIAGFYRAFGLEPVPGERMDHIGVELEFMYFLSYKEAYAGQHLSAERVDTCRYAQKRFLEQHLGRWAPLFLRKLREGGQGYYLRLAPAALTFLRWEGQHLTAHAEELGEEGLVSSSQPLPSWGCGDEATL